ncbi:uncharacterized protein HRG_06586 [Hirsutella rhossiliensis]|uniref:Uncharacterized protein n=1 Tax=Hirsutella rhossiliensis TaxID=111463 RepID=A0A9P8MWI5_9HYPO|nr:uncharacterized protein HRG_06586 [Hirsutella rhossiliensis]KAH0962484.1 hypothetical protein HRG_06586 [Hirsutella rhossiliensis]
MCEEFHSLTVCDVCGRQVAHQQTVVPKWCPVARYRSHFGQCDYGVQHVELKAVRTCQRCRREHKKRLEAKARTKAKA